MSFKNKYHLFLRILFLSIFLASAPLSFSRAKSCKAFLQTKFSLKAYKKVSPAKIKTTDFHQLSEIKQLRVLSWNLLNFFGPEKGPENFHKTTDQFKETVRIHEHANADILFHQEIESKPHNDFFHQRFLKSEYESFLFEGNDSRGLMISISIKKKLLQFFDAEVISHIGERWNDLAREDKNERHMFSRDLGLVLLRPKGAPLSSRPQLVLAVNHLKSKRNRPHDPESKILRQAQAERSAQIIHAIQEKWSFDVPVIFAGDFNGHFNPRSPRYEPEFASFSELQLHSISNIETTESSGMVYRQGDARRTTHSYFAFNGEIKHSEVDGILVSENLRPLLVTKGVLAFKDQEGNFLFENPRSNAERNQQASDHSPIFAIFNTEQIFNN